MGRRASIAQTLAEDQNRGKGRKDRAVSNQSKITRRQFLIEVRETLEEGAMTALEVKRAVQKRHSETQITEEQVLAVLKDKELETIRVRDMWALAKIGDNDEFRLMLFQMLAEVD